MSNRAPKINPTGTTFTDVVVPSVMSVRSGWDYSTLSKEYRKMMDVVGEYIKADYIVEYKEEYKPNRFGKTKILHASVTCRPPLFPEDQPHD